MKEYIKTLREKYSELKAEATNEYNRFITEKKHIVFFEENEDEDEDEIIDELCEISLIDNSGEYFYARVLEVSKENGIYVVNENERDIRFWIGFSDIFDLHDKISIVELLEK